MWYQIQDLLKKAGKSNKISFLNDGIIPQYHWLYSKSFEKEILSHEDNISEENEAVLEKKIETISEEIDQFKRLLTERDPSIRELIGPRQKSLLRNLEDLAQDVKEACGIMAPKHFQPFEFKGVDSEDFDPKDYVFCLSDTNPSYLILKKKNPTKAEIGYDGFFVGAIVNCRLGSLDEIRVSKETLDASSLQDKEVIETIHELRDFYATPFKLGALQVASADAVKNGEDFIVNDYDIEQRLIDYCAGLDNPKSLAITFVAELDNLNSGDRNIEEIFGKIPFSELKEMGIEDFHIDILSCKTMEIADKIEEQLLTCSAEDDIKITTNVYSGYVQNNSSYCYMRTDDRDRIGRNLYTADPGTEISAEGYAFRDEGKKQKKDSLIEVRAPGFSILDIVFEDQLNEIVVSKNISTITTPEPSPTRMHEDLALESPNASLESATLGRGTRSYSIDSSHRHRVEKKFLAPGSEFPQGMLFALCEDQRLPTPPAITNNRSASPLRPPASKDQGATPV